VAACIFLSALLHEIAKRFFCPRFLPAELVSFLERSYGYSLGIYILDRLVQNLPCKVSLILVQNLGIVLQGGELEGVYKNILLSLLLILDGHFLLASLELLDVLLFFNS